MGAIVVGSLGVSGAAAASPMPIGGDQIFLGQVNGATSTASFTVACPGPASGTVARGHAVNDTVGVERLGDPIPGFGRTGDATKIAATLTWSRGSISIVEPLVVFGRYRTKDVPDGTVTPCSGVGFITFRPVDGGSDASVTTVQVSFDNIGATADRPDD